MTIHSPFTMIWISEFQEILEVKISKVWLYNFQNILYSVHMLQMKRTQVLVCKIGLEWELESQSQVTLPICLLFKSTFTCASTHVWKRKKNGMLCKGTYCTILVFHTLYSRLLVPKVNLKQLTIASEIQYSPAAMLPPIALFSQQCHFYWVKKNSS